MLCYTLIWDLKSRCFWDCCCCCCCRWFFSLYY